MITPNFELSQSESELTVIIQVPFAKISDLEISIEEKSFIFHSSPYYLRLNLPGNLIDSEKEVHKIDYDTDKGSLTITCMKQTFGEHFPGLDMLTDLLTPKGATGVGNPLIEVIGADNVGEEEDEESEVDWFYEQKFPEDETLEGFKYGFANSHGNVFSSLRGELCGLVEIRDPDKKPIAQRREERMEKEKEFFDEEHYLADMFEKEDIDLEFEPNFYKVKRENVVLTTSENEMLLKLPRKELLVDKGSTFSLYLSLVDIIFAWCYNHRVTGGENCVESAWNIAKLSSTLSWLDCFQSLKDVVCCSMRRSLIYPLVRNWEFSLLVLQDTVQVLGLGKKQALKCLLDIHSLFNHYEPYYILNQLYITDYCVWIQSVKEDTLISLADSLKKISVCKEEMELELAELESAAQMVLQEEEEAVKSKEAAENLNNVVNSLDQLSVIENVFALSPNDNDGSPVVPAQIYDALLPPGHHDSDDSSSSSSSSSDDDDSDTDSDDEDSNSDDSDSSDSDEDTDSSSGTSSLDSDDVEGIP